MNRHDETGKSLEAILRAVSQGALPVDSARQQIERSRLAELEFARVDLDRHRRCGLPEVIYCPGKTADQIAAVIAALRRAGQNVLATRATADLFAAVKAAHPDAVYHAAARCITVDVVPPPEPVGQVLVVTAGTSDQPVAEEAALTATRMGARVDRVYDAGVAGLHRLLRHADRLREARVLVVVAGMEGALPSVVGGLVDRPVIAVPTSVGYGMNLGGATALLAMLNSCAAGVTVVNVDNGFGAGVAAAMINRLGETAP